MPGTGVSHVAGGMLTEPGRLLVLLPSICHSQVVAVSWVTFIVKRMPFKWPVVEDRFNDVDCLSCHQAATMRNAI